MTLKRKVMKRKDLNEQDIIISKALYELFRDQGKLGADMKTLYEHYLYTAHRQKTDQPRSTNSYCIKALHWGKARLLRAKKGLLDLGIISQIQRKLPDGMYDRVFIRIHRDWSKAYQKRRPTAENNTFAYVDGVQKPIESGYLSTASQTPIKSPSVSKNSVQTNGFTPSVSKPASGLETVNS